MHVNLLFHIYIGGKEKEWDSYKMDLVIRKGGRFLLRKLLGKRNNFKNEME